MTPASEQLSRIEASSKVSSTEGDLYFGKIVFDGRHLGQNGHHGQAGEWEVYAHYAD